MVLGWMKFKSRVRCARCGLALKRAKVDDHTRFKVDHAAWVRCCLAIKGTSGATTPFECPDLKAATRPPILSPDT